MTGSSILPVSIHKNKLYFLFGKENALEDSAKGFSDFGGGMEKNESAFETACREGAEELTGFLGDSAQIKKLFGGSGAAGGLHLGDPAQYNIHILPIAYDENLPKYYNQNHEFLWKKMDKHMLSRTKLFEKINIEWFSVSQIKSRIGEFRSFYQDVLKTHVLTPEALRKIKMHVLAARGKKRRTTRGKGKANGGRRTRRRWR